jgi:hypothetical protein
MRERPVCSKSLRSFPLDARTRDSRASCAQMQLCGWGGIFTSATYLLGMDRYREFGHFYGPWYTHPGAARCLLKWMEENRPPPPSR